MKKCLNHDKTDRIPKCENAFADVIFPAMEARGRKLQDISGYLSACLSSEDKAWLYAEKGIKNETSTLPGHNTKTAKAKPKLF